jgi:hypothetical protein
MTKQTPLQQRNQVHLQAQRGVCIMLVLIFTVLAAIIFGGVTLWLDGGIR